MTASMTGRAPGTRSGVCAAQAGPLAPADELDGHLAAGLVDHLVAEHDRALALTRRPVGGRLLVGVEDGPGPVELLLGGREDLVEDGDLVGVEGPLAVVAERPGALAVLAEA